MNLLSFLLRNSPKVVVIAIITGVISGLSSTGLIAVIHTALGSTDSSMAMLALSFIGLCLIILLTRVASQVQLLRIGQGAIVDLRMNLSRKILAAPLRQLEDLGASRLLATLTDDTVVISNALVAIPILCTNIAMVLGCLVYLGWLSWTALLAVLAFMVVGVISYQLPMISAMRSFKRARDDQDALFSNYRAMTEGTKELKLHHRRRKTFLNDVLYATAVSLRRNSIAGMTVAIVASSWGQLLFFVLIGLLLFALPNLTNIDRNTQAGYTLIFLYMMAPLEIVLNTLPTLGRAGVALDKVETMGISLAKESAQDEAMTIAKPEPSWKELELIGVTHTYYHEQDNSSFILGPLNLTFHAGEIVFMAGGNGSGKTTFAKLLTGLYVPEEGEIKLDNWKITDETRESYRQHFSAIFSDFYLFESLLGLESPDLDDQAQVYLGQLQLNHKVKVENGRFSTTALSQGQRKRLALLTTYLEDRPFYVFDEWAADQDPLFKDIFYNQLLPGLKAKGKTVLVISHDSSYYHLADRIIKLEYGKIDNTWDYATAGKEIAAMKLEEKVAV
jgi:putative pyoverdin transport system ATP-binding/permease protein